MAGRERRITGRARVEEVHRNVARFDRAYAEASLPAHRRAVYRSVGTACGTHVTIPTAVGPGDVQQARRSTGWQTSPH